MPIVVPGLVIGAGDGFAAIVTTFIGVLISFQIVVGESVTFYHVSSPERWEPAFSRQ